MANRSVTKSSSKKKTHSGQRVSADSFTTGKAKPSAAVSTLGSVSRFSIKTETKSLEINTLPSGKEILKFQASVESTKGTSVTDSVSSHQVTHLGDSGDNLDHPLSEESEELGNSSAGIPSNAAALAALGTGSTDVSSSFKNFRHHPDMENFYRFIYENDLRHEALTIIDQIIVEKQNRRMVKGQRIQAH